MKQIKAPEKFNSSSPSIFLAGSIEMGTAKRWQEDIAKELEHNNVTLYNPYRDDFDSTQEQKIENLYFKEQVDWELDYLEQSDLIVVYFDPRTKSPITLMELGLFIKKPMIVCCPEGFWRKGNVDIVCGRYKVPTVNTFEELVSYIKNWLSTQ